MHVHSTEEVGINKVSHNENLIGNGYIDNIYMRKMPIVGCQGVITFHILYIAPTSGAGIVMTDPKFVTIS